jgi:hypothetical protein
MPKPLSTPANCRVFPKPEPYSDRGTLKNVQHVAVKKNYAKCRGNIDPQVRELSRRRYRGYPRP